MAEETAWEKQRQEKECYIRDYVSRVAGGSPKGEVQARRELVGRLC